MQRKRCEERAERKMGTTDAHDFVLENVLPLLVAKALRTANRVMITNHAPQLCRSIVHVALMAYPAIPAVERSLSLPLA